MRIGRYDTRDAVLVVAEIGNNHEGRVELAHRIVDAAADCGADAVKFQTFCARDFISPRDPARLARFRSYELTPSDFEALARHARARGLLFLSTPLDLASVRVLLPLVDAIKIASGDNDFLPLISYACQASQPIIVSTGMTDLDGVRRTIEYVSCERRRLGVSGEHAVLHCVSSYPAPDDEVNLSVLPALERALGCTVGYSDHTLGVEACVAATALGARILEKHFTLDRALSDRGDHRLSADPEELRRLVAQVRRVERLRGRPEKELQPSERATAVIARRSISAAGDLAAGHRLAAQDITWLRPSGGLPPGEEHRVVGHCLRRPLSYGEAITLADVE